MAEEEQQQGSPLGDIAGAAGKQFAKQAGKKIALEGAKMGIRAAGATASAGVTLAVEAAWRFKKQLILLAIGLVAVAVFFVLFLIVIIAAIVMTLLAGGESGVEAAPIPTDCSVIPPTISDSHIDLINQNMYTYKQAALEVSPPVPWEVLAAIHFKESGNDPNGVDPTSGNVDPYHFLDRDVSDFFEASIEAAKFIQNKAQIEPYEPDYTLPDGAEPIAGQLDANEDWRPPPVTKKIKNALWGWNGKAGYQREFAASLGFDPIMEGYEGSAYVMNNWDEQRVHMIHEGEPHIPDGAWKVFVLLKNATYDASTGQIIKLNSACAGGGDGSKPWGCPITGTITTPYGSNIPGYSDSYGDHNGVDIADGEGTNTDIHATLTGTAYTFGSAGDDGGFGVQIHNDEYDVFYIHMVESGRETGPVVIGQVIGQEDNTGEETTGEHVHYVVHKNGGITVNPLDYMPVSLNFTQPAGDDFSSTPYPAGGWGTCDALP